MNPADPSKPGQEPSGFSRIVKPWLSPRRKRFWAVTAILAYTLIGFFGVPWLVQKTLLDTFQEQWGRQAEIRKTTFNPFLFSLRVEGLELADREGGRLAGLEGFHADFQVSSLFRWAWTFREIRLDGPYFRLERYDLDESTLSRLLEDMAKPPTAEAPEAESGELPRLLVESLLIAGGGVELIDHAPLRTVRTRLEPINVEIGELNTLPDREGRQSVTIRLEDGETLAWQGSLNLAPFHSEGSLELTGSRLDQTAEYLKATLPIESVSAALSASLNYRIYSLEDGSLDIDISEIRADLRPLSVQGLSPTSEFLSLAHASLSGGALQYPERTMRFDSLEISEPRVRAWLDENGAVSFSQLAGDGGPAAPSAATADADTAPWAIAVDEIVVSGAAADFTDHGVEPAASFSLRELQMQFEKVSNGAGERIPYRMEGRLEQAGEFSSEGELTVLPTLSADARLETRGIPLSLAQPYVSRFARVIIEAGTLDSSLVIALPEAAPLSLSGAVAVNGLEIRDSVENLPLLAWEKLDIDRLDYGEGQPGLHLSRTVFAAPYARLLIKEDRSTNIAGLIVPAGESSEIPGEAPLDTAEPFRFVIAGIGIENGKMDFSDLSLPLPFATRITGLDGSLSTVSTVSTEPSTVRLEGQVDEFGLARIQGTIDLLDPIRHTDVSVEFRNLLMSNLSPYTIQFAGQEIAEGKLDLNLGYRIDAAELKGSNDVVLSDLVLGDKVEHPEAASLPLGLAVALLKDADGVIDIDLPVEGNVNDPEFRIGGVVWQAIAGLITKVVTAPFRLLGNLVGIDSEDFGSFQFLAGRADLTPPELEKIGQLATALQERPELAVEISGAFDPAVDVPALQYVQFRQSILERISPEGAQADDESLMLDEEVLLVLEALFAEQLADQSLDDVKAAHLKPPANDPEGAAVLDELAYAGDLRDRLLAAQPVSAEDLDDLASARAAAIQSAFLENGTIGESRITLGANRESESKGDEWVILELGVAAD